VSFPKELEREVKTRLLRGATYPLRLREAGHIKATPQKINAQATDWRILAELKRELKA
jgi:hypothetical protein